MQREVEREKQIPHARIHKHAHIAERDGERNTERGGGRDGEIGKHREKEMDLDRDRKRGLQ